MAAAAPATRASGSVWPTRLFFVAVTVFAAGAILFPTYREIFSLWWNTSGYNHCLLIIPISGYLAWLKRGELFTRTPTTSWLGFGYVCLNTLVWFGGEALSINVFEHAGAIGVIIGTIWTLIGNAAFRLLLFPLFYLYFGLPEGDFLVPYLQDLTARVVVILLRATDIPVFLEGRYLTIPSGHFHVAKACSGINYLIATLAVGTVFAYLRFVGTARRLAFMALAILVPLAANGVRAYGIVMIAHLSDYKYAMGVDHFIYGWVFFGVVIFALFTLGNLFSDVDDSEQPSPDPGAYATTSGRAWPGVLAVIALVLAFRLLAASGFGVGNAKVEFQLPQAIGAWQRAPTALVDFGSRFEGAADHLADAYKVADGDGDGEPAVTIESHFYRRQAQGSEVINVRNDVFDDERWRRIEGPSVRETGAGSPATVYELVLRSATGEHRRVWYWYDISGTTTLNAFDAKLLSKRAVLANEYRGEVAVILSSRIDDIDDRSTAALSRFIRDMKPAISRMTR